jgi:tRNA(Arg) A34 adenosine deaminase TadA
MTGWTFTVHACRLCLGTILQSGGSFICSVCRATAEGTPNGICGCGATVFGPAGQRGAGFRCVANPHPTPGCPSHVLISAAEELAA